MLEFLIKRKSGIAPSSFDRAGVFGRRRLERGLDPLS